jgi:thiamine pyrophosphate-dependent acetolactate synthase large subunit-like protein
MNKRIDKISDLLQVHPKAFFIFSNGLTSREASYFYRENRCFYLLHGMGEALSIGIGFAKAQPDVETVVVDGDGNALMGLASWSLMPVKNLHYYILANGVHETTGGQKLPSFPFIPNWCAVIEMSIGQEGTPNPPSPSEIMTSCQKWLTNNISG